MKYKNNYYSIEERIEDLIGRMTLEEKIEQLSGLGFSTPMNERLDIQPLKMVDGPMGVRHGISTAFPSAVGLAASWNIELIEEVGEKIAKEVKAKGFNSLLGPCVNMHRFPLGGRNFESYGEDPFLVSRMAVAFIKGVQSQKVVAAVKHFACNNQEWERYKLDVVIGERVLHEIYLPAFKAAVKEANVWSVMAAYNRINGEYCCENQHLIRDILKDKWGFKGIVISDWDATHSTIKAANSGLDLEMPYGKFFDNHLLESVKKGIVDEAVINDKIKRLLWVRFKAGLFDEVNPQQKFQVDLKAHHQLSLKAARESIVLLKNRNGILPIDLKKINSIAIMGPTAFEASIGGGGSSNVTPLYSVTPLEGLKRALHGAGSDIIVKYALGIAIRGDIHPLESKYMKPHNSESEVHGLRAEYFSNKDLKGEAILRRIDKIISFYWGYDLPDERLKSIDKKKKFSVCWQGELLPPKTGIYKLSVIHNDGLRLKVDGKLLINQWKKKRLSHHSVPTFLEANRRYSIDIEYFSEGGISMIKFGWLLPDHNYLNEAVQLAKKSDIVIIFAGLNSRFESEGHDRSRMKLPNQDQLIEAVANVNPKTVVVINTGGAVLMNPWINKVAGVLQAWYPGQEGGTAITDILLGRLNPSGKLPVSFLKNRDDSPAFEGYKNKSLKSVYSEGIFMGYRYLDKKKIEPLFPFGHGLSYTQFQYSNLWVKPELGVGESPFPINVKVDIQNIGKRSGKEVVQVYIRDINCRVERPVKELKGFVKIFLNPGEKKTVNIMLKREAFSFYDMGQKKWVVEPGEFEILVGSSSRDIYLRDTINI